MSEDRFDRVIDVNLKGVYNGTKAVVDIMLAYNSGCILNASSIVGLDGNFGRTNYAATYAWLASDEASYINGAVMEVSGGVTI